MTRAITRATWAFVDGLGTGKTYYFDAEEVKKARGFLATPDGRLWHVLIGRSIREADKKESANPPALAWEKE